MLADRPITLDRAAGVLLGGACGDALGVPYEMAAPPIGEAVMKGGALVAVVALAVIGLVSLANTVSLGLLIHHDDAERNHPCQRHAGPQRFHLGKLAE